MYFHYTRVFRQRVEKQCAQLSDSCTANDALVYATHGSLFYRCILDERSIQRRLYICIRGLTYALLSLSMSVTMVPK